MIEGALTTDTCSRCGTFITTAAELRLVDGKSYCLACAARPEIDYLEAFRLKHWGKRDVWAWLVGVSVVVNLMVTPLIFLNRDWLDAQPVKTIALAIITTLSSTAISGAYFFGKRWARLALLPQMIVSSVLQVLVAGQPMAAQLPVLAIGSLMLGAMLVDTRSQLFFKLDVSRERLRKAWHLYSNNSIARTGFMVALLSIIMPPLGLIALPLSIVGLGRVDAAAQPPVGRKGQAIAGVIIGGLTALGTIVLAVMFALRPRGG